MGDFRAQIAVYPHRRAPLRRAARASTARRRSTPASRAISEQSERLARAAVAAIPDGVYEAESFMDDDGIGHEPIPIKVRVIVAGRPDDDRPDRRQPASARATSTPARRPAVSAAQVAFKCLTTPTLYPINEGAFRPLDDRACRRAACVSAMKPAAMRWWMTIPMTVVDTIFKALAPAIPERVAAGHHADLCIGAYFGVESGAPAASSSGGGMPGGGWGAKHDGDGMSAVVCINDGDTHNVVIEARRSRRTRWSIEKYALRPDSGGAGRVSRRPRRRAARPRAARRCASQLVPRAHEVRAVGHSRRRRRGPTGYASNAPTARWSRRSTARSATSD